MKKKVITFAMLLVLMTAFAPMAHAKDTIIDKTGDWFATLGKSENDKNAILAQRRLNRAAKEVKSGFQKAGKDMEKAFGS